MDAGAEAIAGMEKDSGKECRELMSEEIGTLVDPLALDAVHMV